MGAQEKLCTYTRRHVLIPQHCVSHANDAISLLAGVPKRESSLFHCLQIAIWCLLAALGVVKSFRRSLCRVNVGDASLIVRDATLGVLETVIFVYIFPLVSTIVCWSLDFPMSTSLS
jgi:hypothetical protein